MARGESVSSGHSANRAAFASLVTNRIVYAVNYYNVSAVFSFIALDLHQTVAGLGLLSSGFLVGIGLFQVPSGVSAAALGPRRVVMAGTAIFSISALLSSFVSDLSYMIVLRFFVGLGMALVFSPGIALIIRSFKSGSEGLAVGVYNSTYWIGGILGLATWPEIAKVVGWRTSLMLSGGLGLLTLVMLYFTLPKLEEYSNRGITTTMLKSILLNRRLAFIGIGLLALNMGLTLVTTFGVFYLVNQPGTTPLLAGLVTSMAGVAAVVSAPFAGRLYDRVQNIRLLYLGSAIITVIGMILAAAGSVIGIALAGISVGTANGIGGTAAFSAAREASSMDRRYESLAIGWVNAIQFSGGFWTPVFFTTIVLAYGYGTAWIASALVASILFVPSLLSLSARRQPNPGSQK
jgi:MFS family permease